MIRELLGGSVLHFSNVRHRHVFIRQFLIILLLWLRLVLALMLFKLLL